MLEIRDVDFTVGRKKILDSVSFTVKTGEFLVITGPNGSGKSSLAAIIMGILKPTGGEIFWREEEISGLSIAERAKLMISYAFQQPVKFKGLTVFDLISIARGELISEAEAGRYLKKVGLAPEEYLGREVNGKLSGGELKRIEIASVLARDADLLIFDEPEAGIDLWSFDDLIKVFRDLQKKGKTLIVISHQERILKLADKILVLEKGRVREFNEARKILPKIQGSEDEL